MKKCLLDQIRELIAQPSKNALVTEQIKELSVLYVMQVLLDEIKNEPHYCGSSGSFCWCSSSRW